MNYQIESKKFPEVSFDEFSQMCKAGKKIFGPGLTQTELDKLFIQECRDSPRVGDSPNKDRVLCRYEFIELVLRMAIKKYMGQKGINTYTAAIDRFLDNDFFPNTRSTDYSYEGFRYQKIQTDSVDLTLKHHEDTWRTLFEKFKSSSRDTISLKEILDLLKTAEISVIDEELKQCFILSKVMPIDELNPGPKAYDLMDFIEFLEFVVRLSEIIDQNGNTTSQKIDHLASKLSLLIKNN